VKILAAVLAILLLDAPAWACAGCRVISEDAEATTVMAGFAFSWGVVAMLAFLFVLCSGLGWFVAKTIKAVDASHGSAG
jgi:Ni/Fe-hydrogenase subunit HybB-like protein